MTTLVHAPAMMKSPMATGEPRSAGDIEQLVELARQGDVRAFERLYRAGVGRVYATCLRLTADPTRAERATQDAFIRAWEKLPEYRGEARFGTWVHRIAINCVLQSRRSEQRRVQRERIGGEALDLDAGRGHEQDRAHGAMDLERAIANLPERARCVLVLHDLEGYRHREIAELLEITEGTSKGQLHRARALLKEALA